MKEITFYLLTLLEKDLSLINFVSLLETKEEAEIDLTDQVNEYLKGEGYTHTINDLSGLFDSELSHIQQVNFEKITAKTQMVTSNSYVNLSSNL